MIEIYGTTSIEDKRTNLGLKDYGVFGSGSSPSSDNDVTYINGVKSEL